MEKYLIIGDVHAEFTPFEKAVDYALANDLHLISVGDLVDNGPDGYKVVKLSNDLVNEGKMSIVWGNHESKIFRWLKGNPVTLTPPNLVTSDEMEVNTDFRDTFLKLCSTILDYINLGDNIFITHAGIRPTFWDRRQLTKKDVGVMRHGQSDLSQIYKYRGETYPIRTYDWVHYVPKGIKLFVGHDPRPMIGVPDFDNFQPAPSIVKNDVDGQVIFLDCGAGKGGTLWGAVVNSVTSDIEQFRNFSI